MLQRFCQYITDHRLFLPSEKIVLTVSGGIDSVVMADLFHKSGFSFCIAHCNFKLRGDESEGDEAFVRQLAEQYQVPFFRKEFKTSEVASSLHISIQMAAKELRYSWFNSLLRDEGYAYFATAHHRNDVIESVLLNLTKGSGIHGLTGIRIKTGHAIRPLLFFSREEIMAYARANKLEWREDSSNQSSKYQRNHIRLEVMPLLKKINPSLEETFEETIEKIRAAEAIYNKAIDEACKKICHRKGEDLFIEIASLLDMTSPGLILYEILKPCGFNYRDTQNLWRSEHTGKKIYAASHVAVRDRDHFIVTPLQAPEDKEVEIVSISEDFKTSDLVLSFTLEKQEIFQLTASSEVACLDYEKLKFPLKIRPWKEGDWFIPLGLGKKKKISDLLVDAKIPLVFKKKVKILISGDAIVWVMGLRPDDRFKVTAETRQILKITMEKV